MSLQCINIYITTYTKERQMEEQWHSINFNQKEWFPVLQCSPFSSMSRYVLHILQCLTNSLCVGSFQLSLGLLHTVANLSLICKESYFFQNAWGGGDIGSRLLFPTKANIRNTFMEGTPGWDFFFGLLNDYTVAKIRSNIYMKITFLYKTQYYYCTILIAKILVISLSSNR